ncbi:MAG: F0F1 ATP synthase subunit A [Kineosporiaceae bacterium]
MSFVLAAESSDGFEAPGSSDFWQPLIGDGAWAITRPMFVILLSVVLVGGFLLVATRNLSVVPGRRQFLVEGVYGLVRNGLAKDVIGSHDFLKFVPLLFTQFLLILVNNLFGVIPPIQFPTFSRYGFAVAVTLVTFVVYHAVGFRKHGPVGYFTGLVPKGLPWWIVWFVWLLEVMTFFITRPLTLSMRLFANMFAGHMLLLVFILGGEYMLLHGSNPGIQAGSIAAFLLGIVMTFFEMFVQFLQAYVFVLLSAMYIAGNLADEH